MPEPPGDFATLLALARGGDRAALDQLAREYEPKLRLVARVLLGPALRPYLDSMDLVQSVHRSLLMGFRNQRFAFDKLDDLLALALTLVRRKAARHWRHLQRQQRLSGAGEVPILTDVLMTLSRPHDDPAAAAQFRDQVDRLCANLHAAERRLLELRLQGHSPSECATELGLSNVAFRVRMTRLRQRLRESGVMDDCL